MKYFVYLFCLFSFYHSGAQKSIFVKKIDSSIEIDGVLSEDTWNALLPATDFWQYFPTDTMLAKAQTEIYMSYDDNNLYVGIKCYASGNDWIVNSLKRDYRAGGNDNVTLIFDSFDDGTNGFFFGINPLGVIREGVINNGGNGFRDFSDAWDNKWKGEAKVFDKYYTAELEIPFSTLRYKTGSDTWGFHAYRFDTQDNEISVWSPVNRNQTLFSIAFAGDMKWEKPLRSSGSNVSIIPYLTADIKKDFEAGTPSDPSNSAGGDMKIAVSSGLNLDLTVNPDFAQVEVDRQVTNIDRFEIFFPERRQFFLENADLFSSFGFATSNPFFSRRIGVGKDTLTDLSIENRIIGGARLSGKLNKDLRVGLLSMQTASDVKNALPSFNYTVATAQHKLWKRSNIGFIIVNKQTGENELYNDINKYNRIAGLDFNFADADNTWQAKTYLHSSFSPEFSGSKLAHGGMLKYSTRKFEARWEHETVEDDYNAEVGFIRRTDFLRINPSVEYITYPSSGMASQISYGLGTELFTRPGIGRTDQDIEFSFDGQLRNSARFNFNLRRSYLYLTSSFDPTGTDSEELPAESSFSYYSFSGFFSSDRRRNVSFSFNPYIGEYFNGNRLGLRGSIDLRFQPKSFIRLDYSYNYFDMPHLDGKRETFLIGPRIDYTFSKDIFLTLFVQYNSQSKNTNINGRFQWRFAPVSDFFLVYTDNYATGNLDDPSDRFAFDIRNRAIVAKVTYWLNM